MSETSFQDLGKIGQWPLHLKSGTLKTRYEPMPINQYMFEEQMCFPTK